MKNSTIEKSNKQEISLKKISDKLKVNILAGEELENFKQNNPDWKDKLLLIDKDSFSK